LVLIFIVQAITQVLVHYFAFKYRGKEGQKVLFFADNKLEAIWISLPLFCWLILGCMCTNIMFVDEDEDTVV
jgi:cytochrome c oxidase subunit 2